VPARRHLDKRIFSLTPRQRRQRRVRARVTGTPVRPRLNVFRSSVHIYAQIIDDTIGETLAAAGSHEPSLRERLGGDDTTKTDAAVAVGRLVAERARAKGIGKVVFDRAGYLYHGRIKALADAAREAGLDF
jgi:large subunit ribosomal protein L18